MLKRLKTLHIITIKRILRAYLVMILGSTFNIFNTLKIFIIQVLKMLEMFSKITLKCILKSAFDSDFKKCF